MPPCGSGYSDCARFRGKSPWMRQIHGCEIRIEVAASLDQAVAACGSAPAAEQELADADAMNADPGSDPSDLVDAYAWAIERALQALQHC